MQFAIKTYRVPVGDAGGRVGKMLQQDILASLPGLKSFICKNASVSPEHFDRIVTALPDEWKVLKTCYEYYLAYGQKREGGIYDTYINNINSGGRMGSFRSSSQSWLGRQRDFSQPYWTIGIHAHPRYGMWTRSLGFRHCRRQAGSSSNRH